MVSSTIFSKMNAIPKHRQREAVAFTTGIVVGTITEQKRSQIHAPKKRDWNEGLAPIPQQQQVSTAIQDAAKQAGREEQIKWEEGRQRCEANKRVFDEELQRNKKYLDCATKMMMMPTMVCCEEDDDDKTKHTPMTNEEKLVVMVSNSRKALEKQRDLISKIIDKWNDPEYFKKLTKISQEKDEKAAANVLQDMHDDVESAFQTASDEVYHAYNISKVISELDSYETLGSMQARNEMILEVLAIDGSKKKMHDLINNAKTWIRGGKFEHILLLDVQLTNGFLGLEATVEKAIRSLRAYEEKASRKPSWYQLW